MFFEHGILEKRQQLLLKAASKGSSTDWKDVEDDSLDILNVNLNTVVECLRVESPSKFHTDETLHEREFVNAPTNLIEGWDYTRRGTRYERN